MRRIGKCLNANGFTLIEIVIVIALIIVISVVVFFSVADYLGRARDATSMMESHNSDIEAITSEIDNY